MGRGGIGVGTGLPLIGINLISNESDSWDVLMLQIGAGAKFLIGNSGFIKTELDFRRGSVDKSGSYSNTSHTITYSVSYLTLLLGIGIAFN